MKCSFELFSDSTFKQQFCNIIEGRWYVHEDSLFLVCKSNRWAIEKYNTIDTFKRRLNCTETPAVYKIRGSKLKDTEYKITDKYSTCYEKIE